MFGRDVIQLREGLPLPKKAILAATSPDIQGKQDVRKKGEGWLKRRQRVSVSNLHAKQLSQELHGTKQALQQPYTIQFRTKAAFLHRRHSQRQRRENGCGKATWWNPRLEVVQLARPKATARPSLQRGLLVSVALGNLSSHTVDHEQA